MGDKTHPLMLKLFGGFNIGGGPLTSGEAFSNKKKRKWNSNNNNSNNCCWNCLYCHGFLQYCHYDGEWCYYPLQRLKDHSPYVSVFAAAESELKPAM